MSRHYLNVTSRFTVNLHNYGYSCEIILITITRISLIKKTGSHVAKVVWIVFVVGFLFLIVARRWSVATPYIRRSDTITLFYFCTFYLLLDWVQAWDRQCFADGVQTNERPMLQSHCQFIAYSRRTFNIIIFWVIIWWKKIVVDAPLLKYL